MRLEGEKMEGGEGGARRNYLSLITISYRSGKCEEIEYLDKISDMKLNTRKQLILSILVMEIYLDIYTFRLVYL